MNPNGTPPEAGAVDGAAGGRQAGGKRARWMGQQAGGKRTARRTTTTADLAAAANSENLALGGVLNGRLARKFGALETRNAGD